MKKPVFTGEVTPEIVESCAAMGLGEVNGKQIVSYARYSEPNQPAVNWFVLEDGTELVRDDDGNAVSWPEAE